MKLNRSRRRIISFAMLAILVGALAVVLYEARDELERLFHLGPYTLSGVLLLRLVAFALFVATSKVLLHHFVPTVSWRELTVISSAGVLFGQLLPAGSGIAAKGVYLNRRHHLGFLEFAGVQTVLVLITVAVSGVIATAALGMLWVASGTPPPTVWVVLTLVLMSALLPIFLGQRLLDRVARPIHRVQPLALVWRQLTLDWQSLLLVGILLGVRSLANFGAMGLALRALHPGELSFIVGGILDALTVLLQVVRITPGNLGLYEWTVSLLGFAYGVSLTSGILAAALIRVSATLASALTALLLLCEPRTRIAFQTTARASDIDGAKSSAKPSPKVFSGNGTIEQTTKRS